MWWQKIVAFFKGIAEKFKSVKKKLEEIRREVLDKLYQMRTALQEDRIDRLRKILDDAIEWLEKL